MAQVIHIKEEFITPVAKDEGSSFIQATFNTVSVMLGLTFLSVPFALEKGGLLGLGILFVFGVISCYTAYILGHCLANNESYHKIAEAAYGHRGRKWFTWLLNFDLVAVLVGYTISLGDNLAKLFPHVTLQLGKYDIGPSKLLLVLAFLAIIPTVWPRNLAVTSYLSFGGIVTYVIVAVTVAYTALFDGLGFRHSVPLLRIENLPNVAGIYAYCFAAHCVFPSIHSSLRRQSDYPKVLIVSFVITGITYVGFAFLGATMFGDNILSQISLNIPTNLVAAKVVLWLVVLIPASKYSLCIAPMALETESKFPWPRGSRSFLLASIRLRTFLMVLILVVAMVFPYYEVMVAFIGSASGMLLAVILPCVFYLKLFGRSMSKWEVILNILILVIGLVVGTLGTIVSVGDFLHRTTEDGVLHVSSAALSKLNFKTVYLSLFNS